MPASREIAEPLCKTHQHYSLPPSPPTQKPHQLPEPTTATFSLPIFEVTVKVRMESGDVNLREAVLGKEADASERKALAEENRTKADVVDSRSQGIMG